jgi:lipase
MLLHARNTGPKGGKAVVCVHGLAQHGGVFEPLARPLAERGRRVVSVDLRGHGASGYEPPWSLGTHVADLLETTAALGIESAAWIGHSFGGASLAALAARAPERVERLVLLDPGFAIPPEQALLGAERDRQDWSFATAEGAANALLSSEAAVATPPETVAAYVADDLVRGADGRLRFRYCPSALVVAWSEMTLPPPPAAQLPTLLVRPAASAPHTRAQDLRYRQELGSLLKMAAVPNGHNVLWESPAETTAAILGFLGLAA